MDELVKRIGTTSRLDLPGRGESFLLRLNDRVISCPRV
jgi:hypothetical protein